jgi:hypothetical protein
MGDKLKITFLASDIIANDFFGLALEDRGHEILVIEERQSPWSVAKRVLSRRRSPLYKKIDRLVFFIAYVLFEKRSVDQALNLNFGGRRMAGNHLAVWDINSPEALANSREFSPDLVITSGVGLLGPGWLESNAPVINLHVGYTPRFRGRFCWFWPLPEGQADTLGVSVLRVGRTMDGGPALVRRRLDRSRLARYDFAELLVEHLRLTETCLLEALVEIGRTAERERPPREDEAGESESATQFSAYLEPGILDYWRFLSAARRMRNTNGDNGAA